MEDHRICTANAKSTGERCRNAAILGGNVCEKHGGKAPQVREAANRRLALKEVTAERTILEIARLAYGDVTDFFDENWQLKNKDDLSEDQRVALSSLKVQQIRRTVDKGSDGTITETQAVAVEAKAWPKQQALKMLAQHFGLIDQNDSKSGSLTLEELLHASWELKRKRDAEQRTLDVPAKEITAGA